MSDKTTVLRAFNNHLFEFLDDVTQILPDNKEISAARTFFEISKKANPSIIVKLWYSLVYVPYSELIDKGDINFFLEKNYENDVSSIANSKEILTQIDSLREPIRNMSETNKEHSLKYIQNLCKLSNAYSKF